MQKKSKQKRNMKKLRFNKLKSLAGRDLMLPVADSFLLEMADAGELTLKGCHEMLCCADDSMSFMTDEFMLTVKGEELFIKTFSDSETTVGGNIANIEFLR